MAKYKVGDKVRILDVDAIIFGSDYFNNGDITEVVGYYGGIINQPVLKATTKSHAGDTMYVATDELVAIEKVSDDEETYHELIERIELLEVQVAENSRLLDEYLSKQSQPIPVSMYEWKDGRLRLLPEPTKKTANELRKEAIEKAKEFVDKSIGGLSKDGRGGEYNEWNSRAKFFINESKRIVVAVIRSKHGNKPLSKGIAKCAPDDVFNVDIGKAIALGRAYGLDTTDFELAPQPDEVVEGMVVRNLGNAGGTYNIKGVGLRGQLYIEQKGYGRHFKDYYGKIISDTEAKY